MVKLITPAYLPVNWNTNLSDFNPGTSLGEELTVFIIRTYLYQQIATTLAYKVIKKKDLVWSNDYYSQLHYNTP